MHGREARIPADIACGTSNGQSQASVPQFNNKQLVSRHMSTHKFVTELLDNLHHAFKVVRTNLYYAADRRKDRCDLSVPPQQYPIGNLVYHYLPRRRTGKNQKWQRLYDAPLSGDTRSRPRQRRTAAFCPGQTLHYARLQNEAVSLRGLDELASRQQHTSASNPPVAADNTSNSK